MLCTLLPANSLPLPVAGIALASIALASIALASIALASTAFRRHTRPQDRHDDTTHFSLATASSYPMYPKTDQEALNSSIMSPTLDHAWSRRCQLTLVLCGCPRIPAPPSQPVSCIAQRGCQGRCSLDGNTWSVRESPHRQP